MRARVVAVLAGILFLPLGVAAEEISSFYSDITVKVDGSFQVTEEIIYDFGPTERRGMFRVIPRAHPQESGTWYRDRVIDIAVERVLRNGNAEPYQVTESGGEFTVRIGDPDHTITGAHTYTITYTVAGALTYYDDGGVDLYWNTTGDQWAVVIRNASARVTGPEGALRDTRRCYAGARGVATPCADIATDAGAVTFTTDRLAPGMGLTIAQALNPELVSYQVREQWNFWWVWLTLGALWLVVVALYAYRHVHHHNPRTTIIPHYEPYQNVKPMYAGLLLDGQLHSRDITAGILYLAEQGFIKIHKTERKILWLFDTSDYEIDLLRDPMETETEFQREVLMLLFGSQTAGASIALSALKNDQAKQRKNSLILQRLRHALDSDLVEAGFYERAYQPKLYGLIFGLVGLIFVTALLTNFTALDVTFFVVLTILTFLTLVVFAVVSNRRTVKGYEARNHLEGFKEFLSVTGKDRFAFHDAPQKSPEQFTQYLPYAVAFGVEKEWAEVFSDVTIPEPSWYDGGVRGGHFAAAALVSDLGSFSTSFSSSSGSSSASGGGGSSGGGAGGGGGGSW